MVSSEAISFVPHPNAMTTAGRHEYCGRKAAVFAIAELVDNRYDIHRRHYCSIQAICSVQDRLQSGAVSVNLWRIGDDDVAVAVHDNGKGMNSSELKNWAVLGLGGICSVM